MGKMISISKVSRLTDVTIKTLKIWDNEGKLNAKYKTPGGHRRYELEAERQVQSINESNVDKLK